MFYPSKIDSWLIAAVGGSILIMIWGVVIAFQTSPQREFLLTLVFCVFSVCLIFWIILGTKYWVNETTLRIFSGPFQWTIPLDTITQVRATRNPLSGPALSLDRLEIRYGRGKVVRVSPIDKAGFLQALGKELA